MALTVIGFGEIGRVFGRCAEASGEAPILVRRGDDLAEALARGRPDPVVVAVREDQLAPIAAALEADADRVVLVQNGLIEEALGEALARSTRGLLWFMAKGDVFR